MIFKDYRQINIRLTDERLKHILNHPEMENQLSNIKKTLKHPKEVRKSEKDPTVHLYFKKFEDTPVTEKYMTAVVKTRTENPFLITAFFTNEIRSGKTPSIHKR